MKAGRLWATAMVCALVSGICVGEIIIPAEPIIFRYGIIVNETIDIKGGAELGTIDSNFPLCLQTDSKAPAAIRLGAGVVVPGDVGVSRDGDPNVIIKAHPSAEIEGDIYVRDVIPFPPVYVPPDLLYEWCYRGSIAGDNVTIEGDGRYDSISIERSGVLGVVGDCDVYVTGDMKIGRDAQVVVTSGSSLTLYLGGDLQMDPNSAMTNEDCEVDDIIVYGTDSCSAIDLRRNSMLWGLVYAPETHLSNAGSVSGLFTGRSITISNSGSFYSWPIDPFGSSD